MKDRLKIEGMMCPHCEARVQEALMTEEAELAAGSSVSRRHHFLLHRKCWTECVWEGSHDTGIAEVTLNSPLSHEKLAAAVESQGYKVLE